MKYYYLDGIEKKGPYTLEEIRSRNLSSDTMIYREDKSNWLPLSDFEELNPIETIESDDIILPLVEEANVDEKDIIASDEGIIKLPKHTILILLIVASIGIAALITYFQQKNDYKKISDEINELFKSKTSISDYYCSDRLDGKLHDVVYHPSDIEMGMDFNNARVEANGIPLFFMPYKSPQDKDNYRYEQKLEQWDLFKNLKQYFIKAHYSDGFSALNLWRSDDVFTIVTYFGGDMAYKVPEKIHRSGTNYGYFSTPGYDIPTNRPSIKNCYIGAAELLTKKDKDSTYLPGSYSKILGLHLGHYKSDYYEVNQIGDKYIKWGDTIHVIRPNGDKNYVINDNKITSSTSRNDAYVYTSDWIVWYKSYSNRYDLEPKKWAFLKYFSIYSIIGIILSFIIYFIIKNRKRIVIEK